MDDNERLISLLRQPGQLHRRLESLLERRETVRDRCQHMSRQFSLTGGFGSAYSRGDQHLAALADCDRDIQACRAQWSAACREAEAVLRRVENLPSRTARRDADVLRLHFLRGLSGNSLHAALLAAGYRLSRRSVFSWQKAACRNAAAILEDTDNSEKRKTE